MSYLEHCRLLLFQAIDDIHLFQISTLFADTVSQRPPPPRYILSNKINKSSTYLTSPFSSFFFLWFPQIILLSKKQLNNFSLLSNFLPPLRNLWVSCYFMLCLCSEDLYHCMIIFLLGRW